MTWQRERRVGLLRALVVAQAVALLAGATARPQAEAASQATSPVPVGMIVPYAGSEAAVPEGWMPADGRAVSRTDYAALFAAIGTAYGAGDGTATFNLPDLRGRFPLGLSAAGTGSRLGEAGGSLGHGAQEVELPAHDHEFVVADHAHAVKALGAHGHTWTGTYFGGHWEWPAGVVGHGSGRLEPTCQPGCADGWTSVTGGGQTVRSSAAAVRVTVAAADPPYQVVRYLVKVADAAAPPCGAVWAFAGESAPAGAAFANGAPAGGDLPGCLDASFAGSLPDLRQRFALGRAASGPAATVGASGGEISHAHAVAVADHTHAVTLADATHSLLEPEHTHGVTYASQNYDTERYDPFAIVLTGVGATSGGSTGAGRVHVSTPGGGGTFTTAPAGAQTPVTTRENPPFLAVNFAVPERPSGPAAGSIAAYGGTTAPAGWLVADGTCLATARYSGLFNAIGYRYGGSGGSFCLPDLRQRFPLGKSASGTGSELGAIGGSIDHVHTATVAGDRPSVRVPAHEHTWTFPAHAHQVEATSSLRVGSTGAAPQPHTLWEGSFWSSSEGAQTVTTAPSTPLDVQASAFAPAQSVTTAAQNPPYLVVNFLIATGDDGSAPPPAEDPPSTSPFPVGLVVPFAGSDSSIPPGWLLADGRQLSRTAYGDLFAAIGTAYGSGDGASTFGVPDLRGRFALGLAASGTGSALGATGGSLDHGAGTATLPEHRHDFAVPEHTHSVNRLAAHSHLWYGSHWAGHWEWPGGVIKYGSTSLDSRCAPGCSDGWTSVRGGAVSATSGPVSVQATVAAANPPYQVVRFLIKADDSAPAPCGALWGYGGASAPAGTQFARGDAADAAVAGCLDASFAGYVPNLQARFALGQAASGAASSLGATGGTLGHTHRVTVGDHAHAVSLPNHTHQLTEPGHAHGVGYLYEQHDPERYAPFAAIMTPPSPTSGPSNGAGRVYTSTPAGGGPLTTSAGGAQTVSSSVADPPYVTVNYILYTRRDYVPDAGAIAPYAGATAPDGWVLADGRCLATSGRHAKLFNAIGYAYGGGAETFCVPDLRGRFPLGKAATGAGATLGERGGAIDHVHSATVAGHRPTVTAPAHSHTWAFADHAHEIYPSGYAMSGSGGQQPQILYGNYWSTWSGGQTVSSASSAATTVAATAVSSSQSLTTSPQNPPFQALNYVIATGVTGDELRAATVHSDGAALDWFRYAGPSSAPFRAYELHRSADPGFVPSDRTLLATIRDAAVTSFRDTTAAPERTFTYVVLTNGTASNRVTVTLPPDGKARKQLQPGPGEGQSTYVASPAAGSACSNHGAESRLRIDSQAAVRRGLLRFDLRDVPADALIERATLSLRRTAAQAAPATVELRRATAAWVPGSGIDECSADGATWLDAAAGVEWQQAGGDFDAAPAASVAIPAGAPASWDEFDVTGLVGRWTSGETPNLGVVARLATEDPAAPAAVSYYADDGTLHADLRPKLAVEYVDGSHARGPDVSVASPGPGTQLAGMAALAAAAGDDRRVESVEFVLDGTGVGAPDTEEPFELAWDSRSVANGTHTLVARATDDAGNVTTSEAVSFTVENSAPPTATARPPVDRTYAEEVLADEPTAYRRLNGAEGLLADDPDEATAFDGSSTRIALADVRTPNTVEAWVRSTSTGTIPIFSNRGGAGSVLFFGLSNGRVLAYANARSPQGISGVRRVNDGKAHHVAYTWDGSTARLYVDGTLDHAEPQTDPAPAETGAAWIGFDAPNGTYFAGVLDEVAVYAASLGGARIAAHYELGAKGSVYAASVLGEQPLGYWRLGDSDGAQAFDADGSYTGTYRGGITLAQASLLQTSANTAAGFDGTAARVELGKLRTPATVEAWVKTTSARQMPIWTNRSGDSGSVLYFGLDGGRVFSWANSRTPRAVYGTRRVDDGAPHHVAYTWDGATGRIYVDGALEIAVGQTDTREQAVEPAFIGYDEANGEYFEGVLDEVAVYGAAVAAATLERHHRAGATSGSYDAEVRADSPVAYWRLDEPSLVPPAASAVPGAPAGRYRGAGVAEPGAPGEEGNRAARFDGIDDAVELGDVLDFPGAAPFSLEAWLRPTLLDAGGRRVIAKTAQLPSGNQGYELAVVAGDGPGAGRIVFRRARDGTWQDVTWSSPSLLDVWTHVVATFDGTAYHLYVNGALAATSAPPTSLDLLSGVAGLLLGAGPPEVPAFAGVLDEVAVYARALDSAQVRAHYVLATGAPAPVRGRVVLRGEASDDVRVDRVDFYVDDVLIGTDSAAPYRVAWDTLDARHGLYDGVHSLTVRAYDSGGQATASTPVELTVDNTGGTLYRADLAAAAVPEQVISDPAAPSTFPVDVTVTNRSGVIWSGTTTQVGYRWIARDRSEDGPTVDLGADLAPGATRTIRLAVASPTLPEGTARDRYTLRFDLREAAGAWFAERGNAPSESTVVVTKSLAVAPGLERYYHYEGEDLGGGMQHLVNLASGNSILRWTPFESPGRGLSTVVDLTYNSLEGASTSPVGNAFSLSISSLTRFGAPLDIHPDRVDLTDGDGTRHRFTSFDGVVWRAPEGVHLHLRKLVSGEWTATRPDGVAFRFDPAGNPVAVEDRNGNRISFELEAAPEGGRRVAAVTDAGGRSFRLVYDAAGLLKRLTDHDGSALDFEYSAEGNLLRIVQRGGTNADGSYLPDRSFLFMWAQGEDGLTRVRSVRDPRGNETVFAYLANGKLASRTSRAGEVTAFQYDTVARVTTVREPLDRVSRYSYDAEGKVTRIVNPLGQELGVAWTAARHVRVVTQPGGAFTEYAYDENGYLTDVWDELRNHTQLEYEHPEPHLSQLARRTDPMGTATPAAGDYEWRFGYDPRGNLTSVTDPLGFTSRSTYNADGTPAGSTDANGHTTTFVAYDANGLVTELRDAKGQTTRLGYDADGLLRWIQDPLHAAYAGGDAYTYRTSFYYDSFGRLGRQSAPKSTVHAPRELIWSDVEYDANDNVVAEIAPYYGWDATRSGPVTRFSYDAMDRLVLETGPQGEQTQSVYDGAGRLAKTIRPKGVLTPAIPDDHATLFAYDPLDRVVRETEYDVAPDGTVRAALHTHYCYDLAGDLRSVTAPSAGLAAIECGAPTPPPFTTRYEHDAAHRLVRQIDPLGHEQVASYDPNGRLTARTNEAGEISRIAYDDAGRVVRTVEPFDTGRTITTAYEYDSAGRLRRVISPRAWDASTDKQTFRDFVTGYVYDEVGRVTRIDLPSAGHVHQSYDANGRLSWRSLPVATAVASEVGSQSKTTLDYWDPGWIRTSDDPATPRVHFDYDAAGRQVMRAPESPSGELDPERTMFASHDRAGRPLEAKDLAGQMTTYEYDANGNLARVSEASGLTSAGRVPLSIELAYDGLDRLVSIRQRSAAAANVLATTYAYDLSGNALEQVSDREETAVGEVVRPGRREQFEYDARGRPIRQLDHGLDPGTADDLRVTIAYTPTGWTRRRTVDRADAAGNWAAEQVVDWTHYANGLVRSQTTRSGAGTTLESHALSYETLDGVYVNGHRTRDVYTLVGPTADAPCRTSTCTRSFEYDTGDRLIKESDGHGGTTTFGLDAAGNVVTEATEASGATTTRTYSYVAQQLRTTTSGSDVRRYFYDPDGNLSCVTDGSGAAADCSIASGTTAPSSVLEAYAYDYRGRLASFRRFSGGNQTGSGAYRYDPLDRVTEQVHEEAVLPHPLRRTFTYVGITNTVSGETAQEGTDETTTTYSYDLFGERLALTRIAPGEPTARYTYGHDVHGNVSLLVGESGGASASYGYRAYGAPDEAVSRGDADALRPLNAYRYSSRRLDPASGTIDMGARRFSPGIARFLQPDRYHGALANLGLALDPLAANRYALAGANPVSFVEDDGHKPKPDGTSKAKKKRSGLPIAAVLLCRVEPEYCLRYQQTPATPARPRDPPPSAPGAPGGAGARTGPTAAPTAAPTTEATPAQEGPKPPKGLWWEVLEKALATAWECRGGRCHMSLSEYDAMLFLREWGGWKEDDAWKAVGSFTGRIFLKRVGPNTQYVRFHSPGMGWGRYYTTKQWASRFKTPAQVISGLYILPEFNNDARCRQIVEANGPTFVLYGQVKGSDVGAYQIVPGRPEHFYYGNSDCRWWRRN